MTMSRYARPRLRPFLESLEPLSLMSVVPLVADGLHHSPQVPALVMKPVPLVTVPVHLRGGRIHGHYRMFITSEKMTKHSRIVEVTLTLTGNLKHVKNLTPATAIGTLNFTTETTTKPKAMTLSGNGMVILASFPDDTLTLSFSNPVELSPSELQMHYKITKGAGMYKGDEGSGTATFTLRVLATGQPWPMSVAFS
jgi:hypothetical protein